VHQENRYVILVSGGTPRLKNKNQSPIKVGDLSNGQRSKRLEMKNDQTGRRELKKTKRISGACYVIVAMGFSRLEAFVRSKKGDNRRVSTFAGGGKRGGHRQEKTRRPRPNIMLDRKPVDAEGPRSGDNRRCLGHHC